MAGDTLAAMLELRQPNNHNFAHRVLTKCAAQDFGEYKRWLAGERARARE